jgi:hypothetical protein
MPSPLPTDTQGSAQGWTTGTLYTHFLQLAFDLGKRIDDHFKYVENSFVNARVSTDNAIESLESRINQQIKSSSEALNSALAANEKAVLKSEASNDQRFMTFNEIRQTASDAAARGISRVEVDALLKGIAEKVDALASRMDKREGSGSGMNNLWMIFVTVGSLAVAVAALFFKK